MTIQNPRVVALFDVDGTLTAPRGDITEEMMSFLKELSTKVTVGIVGGKIRLIAWTAPRRRRAWGTSTTHVPVLTSYAVCLLYAGSDLVKQEEQLGAGVVNLFPWNFSQNGLVAYKDGQLLEVQTISKHLGENNVKRLVNWVMRYLSELDLPVKVRVKARIHWQLHLFPSHLP